MLYSYEIYVRLENFLSFHLKIRLYCGHDIYRLVAVSSTEVAEESNLHGA
jgi:hypothetical protein